MPCPGRETESLRVWGYFPVVLGDILFERAGEEVFGRGREGRNRMKDIPYEIPITPIAGVVHGNVLFIQQGSYSECDNCFWVGSTGI